MVAKKEKY